jgi:DNA-binding NarL/FixJ family response regulator
VNPYRIVLADDHALVRRGVKKIIEEVGDLKVTGEAGDGLELLALLTAAPPDLVILDISMPGLRGIEAIREIKKKHPDVKVLVLTMHADREYLGAALSAGAHGYLLKADVDMELFSAIEKIRQERTYISPHLLEGLANEWVQSLRGQQKPPAESGQLSIREREIIKLVAEGKSSKEIAELLAVSVRTIDRHRANIMDKLDLKNAADLTRYAIRKGYL